MSRCPRHEFSSALDSLSQIGLDAIARERELQGVLAAERKAREGIAARWVELREKVRQAMADDEGRLYVLLE